MAASVFGNVELAPPDLIFGLQAKFNADTHPDKCTLVVGAYRDDDGKPYVLPVVRNVEKQMANDHTLNHEYLPIEGLKDLVTGGARLCLGKDSISITENRVAGIQSLSGTGALSICFQFLKKFYTKSQIVYIPKPTWGNHKGVLAQVGYTDVREYRYLDSTTLGLNCEGLIEDLNNAPDNSIVLLHGCAQNPCGVDPNEAEWEAIHKVCKSKGLLPVFDMAYQGFVSGDPEIDAFAVRYFDKQGIEMFICQSFAKIFGLYNERCGCLQVVCKDSQLAMNVQSQLKIIIRRNYSNPPNHGGRIVATIFNNSALYEEWKDQLRAMGTRILQCRSMLHQKLNELEVPGDWSHIINQKGMFTFTGLSTKQVGVLQEKYHIYLLPSGRINMCAINHNNLNYISNAIKDVVVNFSETSQL